MTEAKAKNKVEVFIVNFREPVAIDFICNALKLSYKQVKQALQSLRGDGVVVRTSKQHDKWIARKFV